MTKTTVYWPADVYERLRRRAFEERTSINKLVVETVSARLGVPGARRAKARKRG